jgi:hypothetical protein
MEPGADEVIQGLWSMSMPCCPIMPWFVEAMLEMAVAPIIELNNNVVSNAFFMLFLLF